jgi:RND family efflux transporter MFP subunit
VNALGKWAGVAVLSAGLIGGAWALRAALVERDGPARAGGRDGPVPVEVAPVERGALERSRELAGTIEAGAEFLVAAKVGGRLEKLSVDISDVVQRGQIVAELDDAEFRQAVAQAEANLAVAKAEKSAADKALQISKRNYDRVAGLRGGDVISEQELDTALAAKLGAEADVAVATAELSRAKAGLAEARVRRDYTRVTADWPEGDAERVVGARFADEGTTVTANQSLLSIVDLDPVVVVVHVTERDYAELSPGQAVRLRTDAFPNETFEGNVDRIAPVFREDSRQARVELRVPNPEGRLKPGMFARARTVLDRTQDAIIVPQDAIVQRDGQSAVFVLSQDRTSVALHPVTVGVTADGRAAVTGDGITGEVVVLGQQQLRDQSAVVVAASEDGP